MKVLVCYKWVLDEADIYVDEKDKSLQFEKAKGKISEYDRNALELGAVLQETAGCQLLAATIGNKVQTSVTDVLSRGPENVYYIESPAFQDADSSVTAKVLAELIRKIGDVDLVICGEGSSDSYSQQVGPRLAAHLGYASITYAGRVALNGSEITAERRLDDGTEVVKVNSPAVITVLPEINKPRIPGLKQILAAKKKLSTQMALEDLGFNQGDIQTAISTSRVLASVMERKQIRVNGNGENTAEAVKKLVDQLRAERVLN